MTLRPSAKEFVPGSTAHRFSCDGITSLSLERSRSTCRGGLYKMRADKSVRQPVFSVGSLLARLVLIQFNVNTLCPRELEYASTK